jgi:Protein of unknown function (DUF3485)
MKRPNYILVGAALVLMGATAVFLVRQKQILRLGRPGVKVVPMTVYDPEGRVAGTNSVPLPDRVLDCEAKVVPIAREVLDWLPKDTTYAQRIYRSTNGFEMLANVVLMGTDRTSIHKPEYCLQGSGWNHQEKELTRIRIDRPRPYDLPVMKITTTGDKMLANGRKATVRGIYVFWFVADGELTAEHGERMWWMARDLLSRGVLQRWAYISGFSVCLPGQEEATFARMKELFAAMVPEFQITTGPPMELAQGLPSVPEEPGRSRDGK